MWSTRWIGNERDLASSSSLIILATNRAEISRRLATALNLCTKYSSTCQISWSLASSRQLCPSSSVTQKFVGSCSSAMTHSRVKKKISGDGWNHDTYQGSREPQPPWGGWNRHCLVYLQRMQYSAHPSQTPLRLPPSPLHMLGVGQYNHRHWSHHEGIDGYAGPVHT